MDEYTKNEAVRLVNCLDDALHLLWDASGSLRDRFEGARSIFCRAAFGTEQHPNDWVEGSAPPQGEKP